MLDNLNTRGGAALYATFPPAAARRRLDRLGLHDPPPPGSWLTMAEVELSVLARQCLDRRIPDRDTLVPEVTVGNTARHVRHCTIDGRFPSADARIKRKRRYPSR